MEEDAGNVKRGHELSSGSDVVDSGSRPLPSKRTLNNKKAGLVKKSLYTLPVVAIIAAAGSWYFLHRHASPVPKSISSSVSFPVYYPDAAKLPDGFTFSPESISSANNTLVYTVLQGGKKLVITEQVKPSDQDINTFYSHNMPIHTQIPTPVGTATVGALNMQNVVSLPTNDQTWLLITYPDTVTKDQLKQLLQTIRL